MEIMDTIWQYSIPDVCGLGISFMLDRFRLVYLVLITLMWLACLVFSKEYIGHAKHRGRYYFFTLATYVAVVGVFLSADLFTTFLFFELMSFTSYVWVAQEENERALQAAATYLAIAVIGGMVLLMGLFMLYQLTGTLVIAELAEACSAVRQSPGLLAAGCCMLFGFGAKAGAFPLHIWLPKAHPVAPAPASALLSGVLTKTGILGILILTGEIFSGNVIWGNLILLLGILTMVWGAILALCSIDLKRTLACSSMSQIGFILVGIGIWTLLGEEGEIALKGTLFHMLNHSLFKLVLFLAAGCVYMNTHRLDLNAIRGFGRNKPLLKGCFFMGALGISGVPLWSGFTSKTLLHEGIVEYRQLLSEGIIASVGYGPATVKAVEWIFLLSGGLTFAYMLKLFIAVFTEKNQEEKLQKQYETKKSYWKKSSAVCVTLPAVLILIAGIRPSYFSLTNLISALISLGMGGIVYLLVIRRGMMREDRYVDIWPPKWDLEMRVYRPVILGFIPLIFTIVSRFLDRLVDGIVVLLRKTIFRDSPLPRELEEGNLLTHYIGHFLDILIHGMNKTVWMDHQVEESQEHKLSLLYETLSENNSIIGRSLSFGLFMSLAGLIAVLVYLLIQF